MKYFALFLPIILIAFIYLFNEIEDIKTTNKYIEKNKASVDFVGAVSNVHLKKSKELEKRIKKLEKKNK